MLPSDEEIEKRAIELFQEERAKRGLPATTPTREELKEWSYWERAKRELMSERQGAMSEQLRYLEEMASEIGYRIVPEKFAKKAYEAEALANKLKEQKELVKKLRERLEELEKKMAEKERPRPAVEEEVFEQHFPPPVEPEPPRAYRPYTGYGEMAVSRECYKWFSKFWKTVRKNAATFMAMDAVRGEGRGYAMISKALSKYFIDQNIEMETYMRKLLECECLQVSEGVE